MGLISRQFFHVIVKNVLCIMFIILQLVEKALDRQFFSCGVERPKTHDAM